MDRLSKYQQAKAKALDHSYEGRVSWTESLTFNLLIYDQLQASESIVARKSKRGVSAISFIADAVLLLDELERGDTTRLMQRFAGLIGHGRGAIPTPKPTSIDAHIPKIDTSVFDDISTEDDLGSEPTFDDIFDM